MPVCFSSDILSCMRWRQRLGFSQAYFSFVLENGGDGVRSQHTFFCKRRYRKCFRPCVPETLCSDYWTLPLQHGNSHRQYMNKWYASVFPIKLYLQNTWPAPGLKTWGYSEGSDYKLSPSNQIGKRGDYWRHKEWTLLHTSIGVNVCVSKCYSPR